MLSVQLLYFYKKELVLLQLTVLHLTLGFLGGTAFAAALLEDEMIVHMFVLEFAKFVSIKYMYII